jgi:hypothetical protein
LTTKAVAKMTQIGACAAISGSEASWAEPANTIKVMPSACGTVRPLLTMAMPTTRPQAPMPNSVGVPTFRPSRQDGSWCSSTYGVGSLLRDSVM